MAIQLLISAGRKTSERSLMIISRSVSRNSSTRFRLVFEENTSKSLFSGASDDVLSREWSVNGVYGRTYFNDIWMMQFTQVLDLSHGRHVETILELTDFNLLYSNLSTRREFSSCVRDPVLVYHVINTKRKHTHPDKRQHMFPHRLSGL